MQQSETGTAIYNPFLEGSQQVPEEEAVAAARVLAEEAAAARSKSGEIKEKAAQARAQKEAARQAEIARIDAEVEAARARVIQTVANIPKVSERQNIRPAPPPTPETLVTVSGKVVPTGTSSDNPIGSLSSLTVDIAVAAVALVFTFLIFTKL